ncbi:AhpC/TSA family protein [Pedobacter sp. MC2016-14]|uniref:TlpA disulfide reductase family protein n=1 Tax=Pedobacter sp. MC2016-14 TaxID=2897327 RepID=UPI001E35D73A|nr:TlpA disulfide reductase family protein [Pedobacter sp. MC2016-14]MCD0487779.1 AhpC/TSA family protein [Pedobacter sp. MC2016-14]
MLKSFIFTLSCLIAAYASAQNNFKIIGKISPRYSESSVSLSYLDENGFKRDTVKVKNGMFLIQGHIKSPSKAKLAMVNNSTAQSQSLAAQIRTRNEQDFYLENAEFNVLGDSLENAMIKGGALQEDYLKLQSSTSTYRKEMSAIQSLLLKDLEAGNTNINPETTAKLRQLRRKIQDTSMDFAAANPDSYVSVNIISEIGGASNLMYIAAHYEGLTEKMKNTAMAKELRGRLEIAKKSSTGKKAIDFIQNDVDGMPFKLSSMQGKYVLIDFWASWCGPCRAENPNVLKAYQKFKDKNFEVLGVSLDSDKAAWLKAIKEDGMPWKQVSDLKAQENAAALLYGVRAIPQNFLLNPAGIIVATNLRGEELEKKLVDIIK